MKVYYYKCNACGKEFGKDCKDESTIFSMNHKYGFGSDFDNFTMNGHLCSECADKLTRYIITKCKINPLKNTNDEDDIW